MHVSRTDVVDGFRDAAGRGEVAGGCARECGATASQGDVRCSGHDDSITVSPLVTRLRVTISQTRQHVTRFACTVSRSHLHGARTVCTQRRVREIFVYCFVQSLNFNVKD